MKLKNLLGLASILATLVIASGCATTGSSLNQEVDEALGEFRKQVDGSEVFLSQAAGYLVFPKVYKAGIGVGAESGEGVLRVGGSTVAYYRTTSGSVSSLPPPWVTTASSGENPSTCSCSFSRKLIGMNMGK